ncbi:uncharacterized protein LOC132630381 [Lycium barbarum]|uniref:uncharacterized protein LOC132630381 n=1 Tax=Lycium barbarum TaxID=112863 RepID=UPI00293E9893|nr:uncharacterized protein LOC132630381 [Lycium barbarum]
MTSIEEYVIVSGDYMGEWVETPKFWNWNFASKVTVPIVVRCNGTYNDSVESVKESGELDCEPSDLRISYMINGLLTKGKAHLSFIMNDRHVVLYMLDVAADGCRPVLRINVVERSQAASTSVVLPPSLPPQQLVDANSILHSRISHMRKVIVVDGTHLYNKYEGVLLSAVAQDTENHTYFFQQLKFTTADEPDLCIISDRHKSIAKGISGTYEHAHHGLCMKHLSENLRNNFQCGDSLHAYFNAAKAYGHEEFDEHFQQFRDKSLEAAQCLEFKIGFEKWTRARFPANMYDVPTSNMAESLNSILRDEREYPVSAIFTSISRRFAEIFRQRHADIGDSNNIFVPSAEIMLREKMTEGDSLFVSIINRDADEFTAINSGRTVKVNLLNKTCSCREYDLVKLPCAHAMVALRLKYGNGYGSSIYKYSSPMYKVQSYIIAFAETINVVPPESEWVVPEKYAKMYIAPPPYEPKLGRKRINRIPGIA